MCKLSIQRIFNGAITLLIIINNVFTMTNTIKKFRVEVLFINNVKI